MKIHILKAKTLNSLPEGWNADGNGLYLRVKNDSRHWIVRSQVNGVRRTLRIGDFPKMSLQAARDATHDAKVRLAAANYSIAKHAAITFEDVALEALEAVAKVRLWTNAKHKAQWYSTIKTYALPKLGKRAVSTITVNDIKDVLEPIWITKAATATRLRGRIHAVFAHAILMKHYTGPNPAEWEGNLSFLLPSQSKVCAKKHHKRIDIANIPTFIKDVSEVCQHVYTRVAILMLTLTATRAQELTRAMWSEFDFENMIWSIPPERRKDKKPEPFRVPITPKMKELLDTLPRGNDYVFQSRDGTKQMHADGPTIMLKALGYDFTMHGMRSTFRDWGAEAGENPVFLEKCLCHSVGNKVQQAYQRSDCIEQRRPIMERWGDYCFSLA